MGIDQTPLNITKADLAEILAAAVAAVRAPNALEQRQLEEEVARDRRRTLMQVELGKVEEQALLRKKNGCSHSRYPMSKGRDAGLPCPKGEGEWCTGGQLTGRDICTLLCLRCSYFWQFKPSLAELDFIESRGLLGMAPPDASRVLREG